MSTLTASSPTSNGSSINSSDIQVLASEDSLLIGRLADLWAAHEARDLGLRWETGSLINRRLGPPTKRSPYGKRLLKQAADRLQIAESDISRMRWFAYAFKSVSDFQAKNPGIGNSWTKVKELLPSLIAAARGKEGKSSVALNGNGDKPSGGERQDTAAVAGVLRSLHTATERLRKNGFRLSEAKKAQLREMIQKLVEAVSDRLSIRLVIEPVEGT